MSRYLVDKFMYQVDRSEVSLKAYMNDPAAFVAGWEKGQGRRINEQEETSGHRFTEEERKAMVEQDFEKLYAMGAHPFLLFTFMRPILETQFSDFRKMVDYYNDKIRPYGRPDFKT